MANFVNGNCVEVRSISCYSVARIKVKTKSRIKANLRRAAIGFGVRTGNGTDAAKRAKYRSSHEYRAGVSQVCRQTAGRQRIVKSRFGWTGSMRSQPAPNIRIVANVIEFLGRGHSKDI